MNRPPTPTHSGYVAATACLATLVALAACGPDDHEEYQTTLSSLVEREHSFARAAAELGTRDAFLAFLAEDAVIFRPRALKAGPYLRRQPRRPGRLTWKPAFAHVARAGDLGLTTGPWVFRPEFGAEATATGCYLSIWKRQADGNWKVVLDHGTSGPPPATARPSLRTLPARIRAARTGRELDRDTERERLLERDRAFAVAAGAEDRLRALDAFLAGDIQLLRNGQQPLTGIEAARSHSYAQSGLLTWTVLGGDVSRSADLGYTYGEYVLAAGGLDSAAEVGIYVRAWSREPGGPWRIIVDLMTPLPSGAA